MEDFAPTFLLLGSGRVARHLQHYFKSIGLTVRFWARNGDPQFNSATNLQEAAFDCSHLLFAVRDDALEDLSRPWLESGKVLVHFSGAMVLRGVHAAHPLMTFGAQLQPAEWYREIPFVVDEGSSLSEILPGLPNPSWAVAPSQRALYHALCSLAGNASYLLMEKIGDEFERSLGLPRRLLSPFLHQVVTNAAQPTAENFTGPVARGDWQTVRRHLQALEARPQLLGAYRQFIHMAAPEVSL